MEIRRPLRFVADQSLGKLVKWLRILGFDTCIRYFDKSSMSPITDLEKGILLTRIRRMRNHSPSVFIESNEPMTQLRQVIRATGITSADIRLLSRCLRCNRTVAPIDKASVFAKVPDYVWENHHAFHSCPECGRIYWLGSHARRSRARIHDLLLSDG